MHTPKKQKWDYQYLNQLLNISSGSCSETSCRTLTWRDVCMYVWIKRWKAGCWPTLICGPTSDFTNTCHANERLSIPRGSDCTWNREYKGSGEKAQCRCWQIKNSLPEVPLSISHPSNIYLQFKKKNKHGVKKRLQFVIVKLSKIQILDYFHLFEQFNYCSFIRGYNLVIKSKNPLMTKIPDSVDTVHQ